VIDFEAAENGKVLVIKYRGALTKSSAGDFRLTLQGAIKTMEAFSIPASIVIDVQVHTVYNKGIYALVNDVLLFLLGYRKCALCCRNHSQKERIVNSMALIKSIPIFSSKKEAIEHCLK